VSGPDELFVKSCPAAPGATMRLSQRDCWRGVARAQGDSFPTAFL
jgi:hypothetical protein